MRGVRVKTPQIPTMAGMTPLGVKPKNDPNDNYAMYEADRVAKRKAQTIPITCRHSTKLTGQCVKCGEYPYDAPPKESS